MMDKDKLRKADVFSGTIIFLVGLYIVSQALKMPMKDSWGGVHNVWYVSPAIFPLFVGGMIALLGGLLVRTALKTVGINELRNLFSYLFSREFIIFLKNENTIRFYAIIIIFLTFVFLMIPRIDFFLAAILFLLVFFCMFHFDDSKLLVKMLIVYMGAMAVLILFLSTGLDTRLSSVASYPADVLVLGYIILFAIYVRFIIRNSDLLKKKFMTCMILAFSAPICIGVIFKFLLLVPMPFEGMVVELMDTIWYFEF